MIKKIGVQQLELGMFLESFCGGWMEHPFWRTRFKLVHPQDLQRIRASSVREVWIDTRKGLDVAQGAAAETCDGVDGWTGPPPGGISALAGPHAEEPPVSLGEEIHRARQICLRSRQAITSMLQEARMGRAIQQEDARALVSEISGSIARNPHALLSMARLKTADDYTYMHSVAVCALMIALARQLGLEAPLVRQAGFAGLLHDIGKMALPLAILNKPGGLTPQEFDTVRQHPQLGCALLQASGVDDPVVLDVCLHHHEKTDGSGYPEGLKADGISLFAKMGAICDVYDAITSDRPYKRGWHPSEAIHKMAEWSTGHFDTSVFQAFVRSIGIYPVGSLVRLSSDRLGVVLDPGRQSLVSPTVKVFYCDTLRMRVPPEVIDLARPGCAEKVIAREEPARWQFHDLDALWMAAA